MASQVATVDQLSDGRAVLGIGVGAVTTDLPVTGEVTHLRDRAAMMDDGIDLIRALWAGGTSYHGPHYDYEVASGDLAAAWATVTPWAEAGCTRWMETRWATAQHSTERMRQIRGRIAAGPPRRPA